MHRDLVASEYFGVISHSTGGCSVQGERLQYVGLFGVRLPRASTGLSGKALTAVLRQDISEWSGGNMTKRKVIGLNIAVAVALLTPDATHAQPAFTTLYDFQGYPGDGSTPNSWLLPTAQGTLFGTTMDGAVGEGTVFELKPPVEPGGAWTETVLHSFTGKDGDGAVPQANLTVGPAGVLYGTTWSGGTAGFGTVFSITVN